MRIEEEQNYYQPINEEPIMTIREDGFRKSYYLCSNHCHNGGICLETRPPNIERHCMCKMPHYGLLCQYTHNQTADSDASQRTIDRVLTGTAIAIVFAVLIGILILSWYLSWRRKKDHDNWTRKQKQSQSKIHPKLSKEMIKRTTLEVAAASTGRRPSELMEEIRREHERAKMVSTASSPIRELIENESRARSPLNVKRFDSNTTNEKNIRYDSIYEVSDQDQLILSSQPNNIFQYDNLTIPKNFAYTSSASPKRRKNPHIIQNPHQMINNNNNINYNSLQKPMPTTNPMHNLDYELTAYRNPLFINNYPPVANFNDDRIIYNEQRELIERPLKMTDPQKQISNQQYPSRSNNSNRISGIYVNAKCLTQSPKPTKAQFFDPQSMRKPFKIVSQQDALLNELLERSPKLNSHLIYNQNSQL